MSYAIAVVDMDPQMHRLFKVILTGEGYDVRLYRDSAGALASIRKDHPNLIILDPWLEHAEAGWRLLAQLQHDPRTSAIPVMLCPTDQRFCRDHANELANRSYVVREKPFDLDEFLTAIEHTVEYRLAA